MSAIGARRRLRVHYYAAMLSAAAVAAALGTAVAYADGHVDSLAHLLGQVVLWLVIVNLAGAVIIFRPVDRHLRGEPPAPATLERRVRMLPRLSGAWLFALAAAAMLGHAAATGTLADGASGEQRRVLAATLLHIGVFAVYLGLVGYFLIYDYRGRLLEHLWKEGISVPPRSGRFMRRLIAGLVAVAVAPVLIPLSDRWVQPRMAEQPMRMAMGAGPSGPHFRHMQQTQQMDLLAALFLAALLTFLMARGFSRPVGVLLDAMQRVDRGELDSKAPVVSDDEFGRLAQQFNQMLDGLRERDRIRRVFGRFVPESVAAGLIGDDGAIAPKEREASVLFTDIENFTTIASRLDPRAILDMLNDYFGELAAIVHARAGVITQFQGDAVLASFNLPVADPAHARHAVDAALAIQERLSRAAFGPGIRLRTRAGISTGAVVGGTVGGGDRLGYTVHGDTVNLAARFEALNKDLGTRVLICARTAELLGGAVALHDRGMVSVRGFGAPLHVFEPLAPGTRA